MLIKLGDNTDGVSRRGEGISVQKYSGIRISGIRLLVTGLILTLSGGLASAQDSSPAINPDVSLEYTVKKGDTLWDIAEYYLRDPWLWPELWNANPQVANPHLIYPGEILYLVWVDGKPRLQREPPRRNELVRLSPQARITPLGTPIPTIPIDAIRAFLEGPRVIDKAAYDQAPYIVAFGDQRLLGATDADSYVKNTNPAEGYRYGVIRIGQRYKDPDSGKTLGYEAIPVARADIQDFGEEVAHAVLLESKREVRIEDRLLPISAYNFNSDFYPHAPEETVEGRIIAVFDGVSQIGQYQIVTLNRGSAHGLEDGHVLRVKQAGAKVKDPKSTFGKIQLPDVDAGYLMVFKTFEELSYGLIMSATRPIHTLDKVTNPAPGA